MPLQVCKLHKALLRGWVSLSTLCSLIGITRIEALKYIEEGKINAWRMGNHYRIYNSELQRIANDGINEVVVRRIKIVDSISDNPDTLEDF